MVAVPASTRAKVSINNTGTLTIIMRSRATPLHFVWAALWVLFNVGSISYFLYLVTIPDVLKDSLIHMHLGDIAAVMMFPTAVISDIARGEAPPWFYASVLAWLLVDLMWLGVLSWPLFGFERLKVGAKTRYSFGVCGVPLRRFKFNSLAISDVRLASQANNDVWRIALWNRRPRLLRSRTVGMLTLDYGVDPFSFGTSLTPIEAKIVCNAINSTLELVRSEPRAAEVE